MKTKLIIILTVLLSTTIYAQSIYSIADSTKTWNTVHGGFWAFMVAHCSGTTSNMLSGDTIIGNETYLKVYETTDSVQLNWDPIGYLREDTVNKLVYYRGGWDADGLIYDFNLDIGDSVYIDNYYLNFTDALLICDSIDSVSINGSIKKRYYLLSEYINYYYSDIWIEDIGSINGLLLSGYLGAGYVGGFSELLCCSKNDTLIYMNTSYNACYIDEFYPKITSEYFDTAYVGINYEFQLQLSDTTNIGSVKWYPAYTPQDLYIDELTGVLYGFPTEVGTFPCGVTVMNSDIGYITDMMESNITVLLSDEIVTQKEQTAIKIYPNPSNTNLFISIDKQNTEDYYLEIINSAGVIIEEKILSDELSKIDCENYNRGIYLLKLRNAENTVIKTEKIILK